MAWEGLQSLEPRLLLAATVTTPLGDVAAHQNGTATVINLATKFDDPSIVGTVVDFNTVMGDIYVELFDVANGPRTAAPVTVANFLHYVNGDIIPGTNPVKTYGSYNDTIFHRSVPGFVVQGGGFSYSLFDWTQEGPQIVNEFSATRSNVRGTIAMAKLGSGPNTATNQFFFNLADNSANLDTQNGGFTVFGRVLGNGMDVVDAIAALPAYDGTGIDPAFDSLPLRNTPPAAFGPDNAVIINSVTVVPELTYSLTNDNPTLLNPILSGANLNLNYMPNQTGTAHVTVRATDRSGTFVESTFAVNVATAVNPPTIGSLSAPASLTRGAQNLTLTANNVTDVIGGGVTKVEFWRDSNGNGLFEPGTDTKLGEDTSSAGGWAITVPTSGWPTGSNKFFVRAQDTDGNGSVPLYTTVDITNSAPKLTAIQTLGTLQRNQTGYLSYDLLRQVSDASDPNGDPLQFLIAAVSSGTLTKDGVPVVAGTTLVGPGETVAWTPATDADGILNAFTLKVTDGELTSSNAVQMKIIINKPPTVTSLTAKPTVLAQPGASLTLTARASDLDGVISKVAFYWDSNGNGTFDASTDTKLGEDANITGGWSLTTTATGSFPTGTVRYFAVATDNTGGTSAAFTITGIVNVKPTVGSVTNTGPMVRGDTITLTANDVLDTAPGTISKVEFWRDLNGNGTIEASDQLLGTAKLIPGTHNYALAVSTAGWATGSNTVVARAFDNNGGTGTASGTTTVNNRTPTIKALTSSRSVVGRGGSVTLTAAKPADLDGTVAKVEFFLDDGDGIFDPNTDTKIGDGAAGKRGSTLVYNVPADAPLGSMRFFARATDNDGGLSSAASIVDTVSAAPTIDSITNNGPVPLGSLIGLVANNAQAAAPGTISKVEFYLDADNDGIIDGGDVLLGAARLVKATHNYSLSVLTTGWTVGANAIIARAWDSVGGAGTVVGSASVTAV